ncbi:MAG: hypothetical protein IIZ59_01460 [Clostridia bacterium]|nr:hypothetical protein [Clostridia bacterium]
MTDEGVFERFVFLSGLSTVQAQQWSALVSECTQAIRAKLREDCDENANSTVLEGAAAAMALWRRCAILDARGQVNSFKAGDVSISSKSSADSAYSVYLQALAACGQLLSEDEFVFGRVESLCTEN